MRRAPKYPFLGDAMVAFLRDWLACVSDADLPNGDMFIVIPLDKNADSIRVAINDGVARFPVPDPENEVSFPPLECGNFLHARHFV
jgi:hypothetical protein